MNTNDFTAQFRPEIHATDDRAAWRDAALARNAERREAELGAYWLRIHRGLFAAAAFVYLLALIALSHWQTVWSLSVLLLGVTIAALLIGAWASPRRPS